MPGDTENKLPLKGLLEERIAYVDPADGLLVNAEVWKRAHGQHTRHRHLHAMTAHRPGIVYGLEVLPMAGKDKEQWVIVAPGVAIDSYGRTIIQPDAEPKLIQVSQESDTQYILIRFDPGEHRERIEVRDQAGVKNLLKLEGRHLQPRVSGPDGEFLELARITLGGEKRILEADHPSQTGVNRINMLYRQLAFPHCYADAAIKEITYRSARDGYSRDSWTNRPGLWNLLHEGNGCGFHLGICPADALRDPLRDALPALLYIAGHDGFIKEAGEDRYGGLPLNEIKRGLDNGSLLFAEACEGSGDFARDFQRFAREELSADLKPLAPGAARLLRARYLFPAVPQGGQEKGELLADLKRGILFSTWDYGAAWQGKVAPEAANPRERVRQALEFGLNIVAYAAMRQRRFELSLDRAAPLPE